jgi:hypothetical protein
VGEKVGFCLWWRIVLGNERCAEKFELAGYLILKFQLQIMKSTDAFEDSSSI